MKLKKQVKQLLADDTTQGTDISGLKTTVGDSSKGLVKDTADLKTAVGADDTAGLKKRCKDIETEIGTDVLACPGRQSNVQLGDAKDFTGDGSLDPTSGRSF